MTLENIKLKKIFAEPEIILRKFLAFVFLSAGIFRIFNSDIAASEFILLGLPAWLSYGMIGLEIVSGLGLFFDKCTRFLYLVLIAFILFVLSWAIIIKGPELAAGAVDLFIFNLTPTDWFLHFTFLLIVVTLFVKKR